MTFLRPETVLKRSGTVTGSDRSGTLDGLKRLQNHLPGPGAKSPSRSRYAHVHASRQKNHCTFKIINFNTFGLIQGMVKIGVKFLNFFI